MGFLDDVKKQQAQDKAKEVFEGPSVVETALPPHVQAVAPTLEMLRVTLGAFARRLSVGMPDARTSYSLLGYGEITDLHQRGYRTSATDGLPVGFEFDCVGKTGAEFTVTSRESCDEALNVLIKAGLQVQYRSHADWKFLFSVKPTVPVQVLFEPHQTDPAIRLSVKNLVDLGVRVERLTIDRIDETFLHQFEQCVLRKPNNFIDLLGNRIPDDMREKFRAQIKAQQKRRAALESEPQEDVETGALHRLKGIIGRFGTKKD